jgi:CheY-like chemotaxis protein
MAQYRTLLVDDQKEVRSVLRSALETLKADIQIVDVPSAEEALLVLSRQPVDLLITDVRLAGITGLELLAKVRARALQLKVILMTGMTDEPTRRQLNEAGVEACFFKPLQIGAFLEAVERCLDRPPGPLPAAPEGSCEGACEGARKDALQPAGQPPSTVEGCLSRLRLETGALYTALIDPEGHPVEQRGELDGQLQPGKFLPALAGSLAAGSALSSIFETAFSHSHHQAVSPRSFGFISGPYRVWAVPVGERLWLVLVSREELAASDSRVGKAAGRAARELGELVAAASRASTPTEPTPAPAPKLQELEELSGEADQPDENLASILQSAAFIHLEPQDVADFWETAIEERASADGGPAEGLSFEQARRLGLAPEDGVGSA